MVPFIRFKNCQKIEKKKNPRTFITPLPQWTLVASIIDSSLKTYICEDKMNCDFFWLQQNGRVIATTSTGSTHFRYISTWIKIKSLKAGILNKNKKTCSGVIAFSNKFPLKDHFFIFFCSSAQTFCTYLTHFETKLKAHLCQKTDSDIVWLDAVVSNSWVGDRRGGRRRSWSCCSIRVCGSWCFCGGICYVVMHGSWGFCSRFSRGVMRGSWGFCSRFSRGVMRGSWGFCSRFSRGVMRGSWGFCSRFSRGVMRGSWGFCSRFSRGVMRGSWGSVVDLVVMLWGVVGGSVVDLAVVRPVVTAVEEYLELVGAEVPERILLVLNSCIAGNGVVTSSSASTIPAQGGSTMLFPHFTLSWGFPMWHWE